MEGLLFVYGATGYTGRLIAERACSRGLPVVLGGRDEAKLEAMAATLGVPYRAARLEDEDGLAAALDGVSVVLNAAGPFNLTVELVLRRALQSGAHYLDVTGEPASLEKAATYHDVARARSTMILPAVGFDVVATDCLSLHVTRRTRNPARLALGIFGLEAMSRGSAITMCEQAGAPVLVRRGGRLTGTPPGALRRTFSFHNRTHSAVAVTWGDVVSAWYSTAIPDIAVYFGVTAALEGALVANRWAHATQAGPLWRRMAETAARSLGPGPEAEERAKQSTVVVAEVEWGGRGRAVSLLSCPDVYGVSADAAVAVAARVLSGDWEPGFQTPGRVFGPDFALSLAGTRREDLE